MNKLQFFVFCRGGNKLIIPKDKIKEIILSRDEIYVNGHLIETRFDVMELTDRIVNSKEAIHIIN